MERKILRSICASFIVYLQSACPPTPQLVIIAAAVSKTAVMPHTNRFIPHSPRISTSYGFIFYWKLNLTAADIVIHFDPWWNVAAQNQATDRAHRIGQENTVTVYELIAEHAIEEQIQKLQKSKQDLAEEILSGESISNILIDRDEILKLLWLNFFDPL